MTTNPTPDYEYQVSYSSQLTPDSDEVKPYELAVVGTSVNGNLEVVQARYGEQMIASVVDEYTDTEVNGTKLSQRSEFKETGASDDLNTASGEMWYGLSLYIDPATIAPAAAPFAEPGDTTAGDSPARVVLFQFHQRDAQDQSDQPAILIELKPDGSIVASFEDAVGKREHTLVEAGADGEGAKGQWIDLKIGANWSTDPNEAWTQFHVREQGDSDYTMVASDQGVNTSTGNIYSKFGVYRSFVERDHVLRESETKVFYDGVRRAETEAEIDIDPQEGNAIGTDYADFLLISDDGGVHIGGRGDDVFEVTTPVSGRIEGGAGADRVSLAGDRADYQITRGDNGEAILSGTHGDVLILGDVEVISFDGEMFKTEELLADLHLGGTDVVLTGTDGNDRINGDERDENISGGAGNDRLSGRDGDDWMLGGDGNDRLNGGNGSDGLEGGEGNDRLNGGSGNDWLLGGEGDDWLKGGAGADVFVFDDHSGDDTIADFDDGVDLISFEGSDVRFEDLNIFASGRHTVIEVDGDTSILLRRVDAADIGIDDFVFG